MLTLLSKRRGTRAIISLIAVALLLVFLLRTHREVETHVGRVTISHDALQVDDSLLNTTGVPKSLRTNKHRRLLGKRADSPADSDGSTSFTNIDFEEYVCKGAKLVQYMSQTAEQVTADLVTRGAIHQGESSQSQFTQFSDLQTNGWRKNPNNPDLNADLDFDTYLPISNVMQSLGLSTTRTPEGENILVAWEHTADVTINGKQYWATGADYTNVYNPTQGLIIANYNYGPAYQIYQEELAHEHPDIVPPPMKQWSDIAFLEYQSECQAQGKDLKNLKYFLRYTCQNPDTTYVVDASLDPNAQASDDPVMAPVWSQRQVFGMETDEGTAILASPNGNGVAWMLILHKAQFGRKTVASVSVFRESLGRSRYTGPSLLFEIVDG